MPCACHLFFSLFRRDLISSKCLGGNTYVSVRFCAESVERRWRSDFFFFDLLTASNTKGWFLLNSNIGENVSNKTHVCFQDGTQILSMWLHASEISRLLYIFELTVLVSDVKNEFSDRQITRLVFQGHSMWLLKAYPRRASRDCPLSMTFKVKISGVNIFCQCLNKQKFHFKKNKGRLEISKAWPPKQTQDVFLRHFSPQRTV